MVSFEQAFSDMEKSAASTVKSAADLTKLARALEKAAKDGNIAAAKRAQHSMSEALNALRQEVRQLSVESWPFGDEEEQQYLNDGYGQELRTVAAERGLEIYERDGRMIAHPSIVRVLPGSRAVRIDRKQVSTIRPTRLTDILLDEPEEASPLPSRPVPRIPVPGLFGGYQGGGPRPNGDGAARQGGGTAEGVSAVHITARQ